MALEYSKRLLLPKSPVPKASNPVLPKILKKYRKVRNIKDSKLRTILPKFSYEQIKPSSGPDLSKPTLLDSKPNPSTASRNRKGRMDKLSSVEFEPFHGEDQDLEALMKASTTIIQVPEKNNPGRPVLNMKKSKLTDIKKRNKLQRDIEASLNILFAREADQEIRDTAFAQYYLEKVRKTISEEDWLRLLEILSNFDTKERNVVTLFQQIQQVLHQHPNLIEDFVGILSPQDARAIGRYIEYSYINNVREFLHSVLLTFGKNPNHLMKFWKSLKQVQNKSGFTFDTLKETVLPLLKGHHYLIEQFNKILMPERPGDSCVAQFEEVTMMDVDLLDPAGIEFEQLPDNSVLDTEQFGTDSCPCFCHSQGEPKFASRSRHCDHCGVKFLDGKVYLQTGKVLRPARITYHSPSSVPAVNHPKSDTLCISPKSDLTAVHDSGKNDSSPLKHDSERNVPSDNCPRIDPAPSGSAVEIAPTGCETETSLPSSTRGTADNPDSVSTQPKSDTPPDIISDDVPPKCDDPVSSADSNSGPPVPCSNDDENTVDEDCDTEVSDWVESEDRVILIMVKTHGVSEETIDLIAKELAKRTNQQISARLNHLLSLIVLNSDEK